MASAGTAIRVMREAQGLTLRELAELSGTSFAYLSLVERDERTPSDRWIKAVNEALARHMLGERAS